MIYIWRHPTAVNIYPGLRIRSSFGQIRTETGFGTVPVPSQITSYIPIRNNKIRTLNVKK